MMGLFDFIFKKNKKSKEVEEKPFENFPTKKRKVSYDGLDENQILAKKGLDTYLNMAGRTISVTKYNSIVLGGSKSLEEFLSKEEERMQRENDEMTSGFDKGKYEYYLEKLNSGEKLPENEWKEFQELSYKERLIEIENSPNPKHHRSNQEEDLKHEFSRLFRPQIEKYENEIYRHADMPLEEGIRRQIKGFDDFKKFAYSKGEGGKLYFQDMWENCHNSQNPCFSFRDPLQKDLDKIILLKKLPEDIISVINDVDGILQRDIYKHLKKYEKSDIQKYLRDMDGKQINREKKGSTYYLTIK